MLKIALLGYGKMGKAIEQEALARGHEIPYRIDLHNAEEIQSISPDTVDVVIEFTHPDSFENHLDKILEQGVPMVSGTTGWYDRMNSIKKKVDEKQGTFLYSSNFSIGVNLLFKLNQQLAKWMNPYPQYDCYIEEHHHRHKADAPSGTAHSLAQQVLSNLDRKTEVVTDALQGRPPKPEELSVGYIRSGEIIGRHKIAYTSEIDTLFIEHSAHNRRGFALGAVIAAEWLAGKSGWYEFSEIL